jgi:protein TonB
MATLNRQRSGTMRHDRSFAPELRSPYSPTLLVRRRRVLPIAVSLSVAAHMIAALLVVLLPRIFPPEDRSQDQGTVELLMVEQKGGEPRQGALQDDKPAAEPPPRAAAPKQEDHEAAAAAHVRSETAEEPVPPQSQQAMPSQGAMDDKPAQRQVQAEPAPARPAEAPIFNLEGTESETNARALGDRILPAMPDNRFRNRPPVYPAEAEMRGDHGAVLLVIHVAENGTAASVSISRSSGVKSLDEAAKAAIMKWHFHPAMHEGRTVPFDMPFQVIFEANSGG